MIANGLRPGLKATSTLVAAALVGAACSSNPAPAPDTAPKVAEIRALRWLAPEADKVRFLIMTPAGCEKPAVGADAGLRLLGKLAFESPALLGGAAARMGLSCSSCHLNGRGNPDFFLEGVSGKPGTADVTSSLLSKVRGDGHFNPVVIPDVGMRDGKQIRDRTSEDFRTKVHGLIVEEFDGQEPPRQVFNSVIAYLDGLDPSACSTGERRSGPGDDLEAARAAYEYSEKSDTPPDVRVFYLRVARFRLERIHERLPDADQEALRRELVSLSSDLGVLADAARIGQAMKRSNPDWVALRARLEKAVSQSYYNPARLREALAKP